MSATTPDQSDRDFCVAMLPQVSRTFALSIEALPASLRRSVRVAYLLCRIVDSIEDATEVTLAEREALFGTFEVALSYDSVDSRVLEQRCDELLRGVPPAEQALGRGAGAVLREFRRLPWLQQHAIRPRVLEMTRGMREYAHRWHTQGRLRLDDLSDLERYCYFVAGTVGELLTDLFAGSLDGLDGWTRAALERRAVSFGIGLQLVNILKDVAEDHARGVCYLPKGMAEACDVDLDQLLDSSMRVPGLELIGRVAERARDHLRQAAQYTLLWPASDGPEIRRFCAVPLLLALHTLDEVEHGDDTLRPGREPKVSRGTVMAVMGEALQAVTSDVALGELLWRSLRPRAPEQSAPAQRETSAALGSVVRLRRLRLVPPASAER